MSRVPIGSGWLFTGWWVIWVLSTCVCGDASHALPSWASIRFRYARGNGWCVVWELLFTLCGREVG